MENHIEKVKRFGEFGMGKKPAVKLEFGEVRVRFWEGSHGESEVLKDLSCCWEVEGWRLKRKNKKKKVEIERGMLCFCLKKENVC